MDADPTNVNYLNTFLQVHTNSGQEKNDVYFQANLGTFKKIHYLKLAKEARFFIISIRYISVADPDPGSGAFLAPGSGI